MHKINFLTNFFKRHFLYLGLMPFLFFIKGLLSYPYHISLLDLISCLSLSVIGSYVLFNIVYFLFKDRYKAAYCSFLILVVCFLSVDIYYILFSTLFRIRYYLLGVVLLMILIIWILKVMQPYKGINKILNVFSVVFFLLYLINSVDSIKTFLAKPTEDLAIAQRNFDSSKPLPDIYILLLDGYANSNNLKKYWHFSNDSLFTNLRSQGFHIVDSSHSNYKATVQTVSSMLNMEYCQQEHNGNETPFLFDIVNNKTINILSQHNYAIYNYSLFDFDKYSSPNRLNAFPEHSSLLYHCLANSIYFFYKQIIVEQKELLQPDRKDRELYSQLMTLSKLKSDKPKFVYGHFFVSHPPFYLDSTGKVNREIQERSTYTVAEGNRFGNKDTTDNTFGSMEKDRTIMKAYLNHIKATNRYVLPLVDSILINAQRPPIILIMSDHGFRYATGITNREFQNEAYENLCAFYFPDRDYNMVSSSITPVNYMRLILNKSLGMQYKLLPDKSHL